MATIDPPAGNVMPLRKDDHADAARIAIDWLSDRHRKVWKSAFESWFDRLQPVACAVLRALAHARDARWAHQ